MKHSLTLLTFAALGLSMPAQTPCGTPGVTITVSPPTAAVGQVVQVTLTNDSGELIQLPSGCVFGPVYPGSDCTSTPIFTPSCAAVVIPIASGSSISSFWLQTDNLGQQVPPGAYSLGFSYWNSDFTVMSSCCVPLTISGNCVPSRTTPRNGSGVNPLTLVGAPPTLGLDWQTSLDCSAHAPGLAGLYVYQLPAHGVFTAFGELLIGGARYGRFLQGHTGTSVAFREPIPTDVGLCGLTASAQGVCLGAPGPRLSNALDLVLGI